MFAEISTLLPRQRPPGPLEGDEPQLVLEILSLYNRPPKTATEWLEAVVEFCDDNKTENPWYCQTSNCNYIKPHFLIFNPQYLPHYMIVGGNLNLPVDASELVLRDNQVENCQTSMSQSQAKGTLASHFNLEDKKFIGISLERLQWQLERREIEKWETPNVQPLHKSESLTRHRMSQHQAQKEIRRFISRDPHHLSLKRVRRRSRTESSN